MARVCRSNQLRSITANRKTLDVFSLRAIPTLRSPSKFAIIPRLTRDRDALPLGSALIGAPVGCPVTIAQYRLAYLWSSKNLNKFPTTGDERLVSSYPKGWLFIHLIRAAAAPLLPPPCPACPLEPRSPSFDFRQSFTAFSAPRERRPSTRRGSKFSPFLPVL